MYESLKLQGWTLGPFATNSYLLIGADGRKAAWVDPGFQAEVVWQAIEEQGLEVSWIVNTHGHIDHVAGNHFAREKTGAPLIIHEADRPFLDSVPEQARRFGLEASASPAPDHFFQEAVPFNFEGVDLDVIHTPGHSPGGVCLKFGARMLVGDTLFQGSIGRTDLPGGSMAELVSSIREKLFCLPDETYCFTGHGEPTTLGDEKRTNPFVSDRAVAGGVGDY